MVATSGIYWPGNMKFKVLIWRENVLKYPNTKQKFSSAWQILVLDIYSLVKCYIFSCLGMFSSLLPKYAQIANAQI